jgi:hypothetical protein
MRQGHIFFQLELDGPAYIVHRGVSQGGKKLSPEQRLKFWEKRRENSLPGMSGHYDTATKNSFFSINHKGLQNMKEKAFVIVSCPENPRIWTPKRIMAQGQKKSLL